MDILRIYYVHVHSISYNNIQFRCVMLFLCKTGHEKINLFGSHCLFHKSWTYSCGYLVNENVQDSRTYSMIENAILITIMDVLSFKLSECSIHSDQFWYCDMYKNWPHYVGHPVVHTSSAWQFYFNQIFFLSWKR